MLTAICDSLCEIATVGWYLLTTDQDYPNRNAKPSQTAHDLFIFHDMTRFLISIQSYPSGKESTRQNI